MESLRLLIVILTTIALLFIIIISVYNIGNLTIKKTQNELDKNSKDNYKLLLEIKKLRDELEKDIKKAHLVEQNIQEQELTLFNKNNTDSFEYRSIW